MKIIIFAIVIICSFAAGLVTGAALALPDFEEWSDDEFEDVHH